MNDQLKEAIYNRTLRPMHREVTDRLGVEFEFPVVNLSGEAVDFSVCHDMTDRFTERFYFTEVKRDRDGHIFSATNTDNGDNLSFDCSYNTLEFSFGAEEDINTVRKRFEACYSFVQDELNKEGHCLTGMGINPHHRQNHSEPVPTGRYEMLFDFLKDHENIKSEFGKNTADFGLYACASQVQLDVSEDTVCDALNVLNLIEPYKAVLFANSVSDDRKVLLSRDDLWRYSNHGCNPHNVYMYGRPFQSPRDILNYCEEVALFCAERDGHYLYFPQIPIKDYFERKTITGYYRDHGRITAYDFEPSLSDLEYSRTYHLDALTFRGTVECRSVCMQPVKEIWASPAFHAGIMRRLKEVRELVEGSVFASEDPKKLREELCKRNWKPDIPRKDLSDLLTSFLQLAEEGLAERGRGEEVYLEPLWRRAEGLLSPGREMADGLDEGRTMNEFIEEYGKL